MNSNENILNQFKNLENSELSMNIMSINSLLTQIFQNYSISLNKISGNSMFANTVMREIRDYNGLSKEYGKGQITFKNGVDKLRYLLNNRERVSKAIGVDASEIWKNRRNLGLTSQYIAMMDGKYELGSPDMNMQMYISKHDGNVQNLDSQYDWVDYILTQDWIDSFANRTIGEIEEDEDLSPLSDFRIEYLSDYVQEMMADHEVDYHKELENFQPDDYLNVPKTRTGKTLTKNKINSINKLDYGFYEMFKPIGGTTDKYIKVKLSANGILDISGVIGLSDCTKVEWNYGSRAYLRALNTGNERYDFKLSIPFNDNNSQLWWKPDEKDRISNSPTGQPRYRYYRPYETERFLRWFGTSYIPLLDPKTIVKKTVCSAKNVQGRRGEDSTKFSDATMLIQTGVPSPQSVKSSTAGLFMHPMSTIDLIQKDDGQYLRFVVAGNQGIQNLSFNIRGKMLTSVQEMNHYSNTWNTIRGIYYIVQKHTMLLELIRQMNPDVEKRWLLTYPAMEFIPQDWYETSEKMQEFMTPNAIDLIRFRHIDFSQVMGEILANAALRIDFLRNKITDMNNDIDFKFDENLYEAIMNFDKMERSELEVLIGKTTLTDTLKENLLETLVDLSDMDEGQYRISFDDITVDELRKRIKTFNNLIVRLPKSTPEEKTASRNTFMDWKKFVDGATRFLVDEEMLFVVYEVDGEGNKILDEDGNPKWEIKWGKGTDGKQHPYTEVYIDPTRKTPLIDYSYCKDENGKVIHDRFDYWGVEDFR